MKEVKHPLSKLVIFHNNRSSIIEPPVGGFDKVVLVLPFLHHGSVFFLEFSDFGLEFREIYHVNEEVIG